MYCGYLSQAEDDPFLKHLQIIDKSVYDRVQNILDQRALSNDVEREVARYSKTKLLLSGICYCGHCGSTLSTMNHNEKYTRKDGTVVV